MAAIALFLDEDVHEDLAAALRRRGIAVSQKRAVMTFNLTDFEVLADEYFWQGKYHFGIVVSPQRPLRETLRRLINLAGRFTRESFADQLVYL